MRLRWGIACILLMAACTRPDNDLVETRHGTSQIKQVPEPVEGPSQKLQAIDSMIWRQPDSALAVLMDYLSDDGRDGVHTVSTNETFDNHYTQLLVSELLYKNDYKQTNREDLLQAVSYFDSLTLALGNRSHAFWRHCGLDPQSPKPNDDIAFLDARAHYINGVGYYEKDCVVEACKEYLKTLEVMEDHFEEKELLGYKAQFMALTYTRLTDLFSNLYLHEQAIHFGKLSLKYYQKYNPESWHIAWILEEIGSHYDMMDSFDSASYYYQKASQTLQDTNSLSYRDISTHRALLSYNMEKNADAALSQLFDILSRSESEKESLARCAIIGEIFYTEKQYDSAWVYLNKVFHESPILDSKKQAAEWLVEISKVQNRETEILEYADFLVPFANLNENQSSIKSQMATLYHEYEQKRIDSRHQQKMSKNQKKANKAIGLLLGIITIVFVLYLVSKKRHYKVKKQNEETEHQLKIERQAHKMEQAALAGRLRKSNNALVQQKEEKEHLLKTLRTHQEQSG